MKTKKQKTAFVGFRADERLVSRVDSLAEQLGMSTSMLIRRMIGYIDDRGAPCGRLTAFKEYVRRMDRLTSAYL